jgi:hypothetical protein
MWSREEGCAALLLFMVMLAEAAAFAHAFIRNTSTTRAPCPLIEPQARVALGLIAGHDVKSPTIGKVDPLFEVKW